MNLELVGAALDKAGLKRLHAMLDGGYVNEAAGKLIAHVMSIGARFIVIEKPYTDQDYSADFLGFYAAAFKSYPRFTQRIHFFKEDVSEYFSGPMIDLVEMLSEHQSYLGFVVLRPIKHGPIGRTVLPFPKLGKDLVVRPAARAAFKVHLYGAPLEVEGAPFIQQDTRVGACAQAAIWMANRPLHERHGRCGWHPVSDITRLATTPTDSDLSKSLPAGSNGLSPLHITRALRAMGHQPYCDLFFDETDGKDSKGGKDTDTAGVSKPKPSPAPSVIRYLDSGLPVILGMAQMGCDQSGHAITAVGYVETTSKAIRDSGGYDAFVRAVVVHDDQRGPYLLLPLTRDDIPHLPENRLLLVDGKPICLEEAVTHIFVPLSPRVFLIADRADIVARNFIDQLAVDLSDVAADLLMKDGVTNHDHVAKFKQAVQDGEIICRTYLTTAGRYRYHLSRGNLADDVKIEAITRTLPHFVWVTELLYPDSTPDQHGAARDIAGHIVVNATSSTDQDSDLLFAYLPNIVVHRDVDPPADNPNPYIETAKLIAEHVPYAQRLRV